MYHNFIFEDINEGLPALAGALMRHGHENGSRNGVTKELTHVGITLLKPHQREILLGSRKANLAAQIAETVWVLSGRNDIGWLGHYLPRAAEFSDDGKTWRGGYGPRLRAAWGTTDGCDRQPMIDQWGHMVELLRADPLTRRATATIYDPAIDTEDGKDIPCNDWLTFSSRLGRLDLHVGVRSNDLMWGWSGINAFEWSAMLEITAGMLGVDVGALHFSTSSLHLYGRHWAKAEMLATTSLMGGHGLADSPRFNPTGVDDMAALDYLFNEWFTVEAMIRERSALAADDRVLDFPEPMLQSWLRVLQWWWSGDHQYLRDLGGTRLEYATHVALQPKREKKPDAVVGSIRVPSGDGTLVLKSSGITFEPATHQTDTGFGAAPVPPRRSDTPVSKFLAYTFRLHEDKHRAYGDSWKRRGEMLGILANIARKVDRLGGGTTDDETSADTAMDLMVYLAKYRTWLDDRRDGSNHSDHVARPHLHLLRVEQDRGMQTVANDFHIAVIEAHLRTRFDDLEFQVANGRDTTRTVDDMLASAYTLARVRWEREQQAEAERLGGTCANCGSLEVNHGPGGSRSYCTYEPETYRGADAD